MKTTLDIDDHLLMEAKALGVRERKSLTKLIEEGLSLRLRPKQAQAGRQKIDLPVSRHLSGFAPGIDPYSNKSMLSAADDDA